MDTTFVLSERFDLSYSVSEKDVALLLTSTGERIRQLPKELVNVISSIIGENRDSDYCSPMWSRFYKRIEDNVHFKIRTFCRKKIWHLETYSSPQIQFLFNSSGLLFYSGRKSDIDIISDSQIIISRQFVFDENGTLKFSGGSQSVVPQYNGFHLVYNNGWGLLTPDYVFIRIPHKYAEEKRVRIVPNVDDYFVFYKSLYDLNGIEIIGGENENYTRYIINKESGIIIAFYCYCDEFGRDVSFPPPYFDFYDLAGHFLYASSDVNHFLINDGSVSGNYMIVCRPNNESALKKSVVDKQYNLLFPFVFDEISRVSQFDNLNKEWTECAKIKINGRWGVINALGKIIVPPEFDYLVFSDSAIIAWQRTSAPDERVSADSLKSICTNGHTYVFDREGRRKYLYEKGKLLHGWDIISSYKLSYRDDIKAVRLKCKDKFRQTIVDNAGNLLFPLTYDRIKLDSYWVDRKDIERSLFFVTIDSTYYFEEQLGSWILNGGKVGVVDYKGEIVIPIEYDGCSKIYKDTQPIASLIRVRNGDYVGLFNSDGMCLLNANCSYIGVEYQSLRYARFNVGGIISKTLGKTIIQGGKWGGIFLAEGRLTVALYDAFVFDSEGDHIAHVVFKGQAGFLTKDLKFVPSDYLDPQLISLLSEVAEEITKINDYHDYPREIPIFTFGQQAINDQLSEQIRKQIQNKNDASNIEDISLL